jgi:hypothetical protein
MALKRMKRHAGLRRALGIRVFIAGCLVAVSIASGCGGSGGAADRKLSDGLVPPFAKALGCQTQSYAFGTLSRLTTCAYSGRASTAAIVRYVENRLPTGGSLHTDNGPAPVQDLWDKKRLGITLTVGHTAKSVDLPRSASGADRQSKPGFVFLVVDILRRN